MSNNCVLRSVEVTVKFAEIPDDIMYRYLNETVNDIIGEIKLTSTRMHKSVDFGFCEGTENHFFDYDKTILLEKLTGLDTGTYYFVDSDLTKEFIKSADKIDYIHFDEVALSDFRIQSFLTIKFIFSDGEEYYVNDYIIDEFNERFRKGLVENY